MTDFEKELIHYIFHVQDADDDNLSAEVICRKLYKYGLIDRGRGYWRPKKRPKYRWPARAIRKAEQTEPHEHEKIVWHKDYGYIETEPSSSEKTNNCEGEPQYDFGEYADRLWKIAYERGKREALEQTEPSCDTCKLKDTTEWCKRQEVCRAYQPKDEPQTCDGCQHYADKHTADACYECSRSYADCYVPQTDCPKSCPSIDICTKDDTDCAWK